MIKLGIEIKEDITTPDGKTNINIKLVDPTKKQLNEASENEKVIAQKFKDLFDNSLVSLLENKKDTEEL